MKLALLCPGQGAQSAGYLHRLPDHVQVRHTLQQCSDVLGQDALAWDQPDALRSTVSVQLGLLAAGVAWARLLEAEGVRVDVVAGLSLGSFTAAVIAGVLSLEQALALVYRRASGMQQAFPSGYGLAAVAGLSQSMLEAVLAEVNAVLASPLQHAYLANLNTPTQFVIAGHEATLERVLELSRQRGARETVRLPVAVPSHCPLLAGVASGLRQQLQAMQLGEPRLPCLGNVQGRLLRSAAAVADDLADNVMRPVRWSDGMRLLLEHGLHDSIELAPGQTLSRLLRQLDCSARCIAVEDASLDSLQLFARRARQGDLGADLHGSMA